MKLYIVSGLGADRKVFEKIKFPSHLEIIFIDWLIPEEKESFAHYVDRMGKNINSNEPFYLLGYSMGGMIVQEIHKKMPAQKVVIMASIKSSSGKSKLMNWAIRTKVYKMLPTSAFNDKSYEIYGFLRKLFDPRNPEIFQYFRVRDPQYIRWCVEKALEWECTENPEIVQILGDKDIVFPIEKSNPDYIIKDGPHLFPVTKAKEVSAILNKEFY